MLPLLNLSSILPGVSQGSKEKEYLGAGCLSVAVAHHKSRPRADTVTLGGKFAANLTIQHAASSIWCMRLRDKALLGKALRAVTGFCVDSCDPTLYHANQLPIRPWRRAAGFVPPTRPPDIPPALIGPRLDDIVSVLLSLKSTKRIVLNTKRALPDIDLASC